MTLSQVGVEFRAVGQYLSALGTCCYWLDALLCNHHDAWVTSIIKLSEIGAKIKAGNQYLFGITISGATGHIPCL